MIEHLHTGFGIVIHLHVSLQEVDFTVDTFHHYALANTLKNKYTCDFKGQHSAYSFNAATSLALEHELANYSHLLSSAYLRADVKFNA